MDGILVLAKPRGPTSHDMVALVRRLTGTRRVGHGGTLDPFATGVLPIFLGKATRVVEFHLGANKQYRATVCFGASSGTDDLEGELSPVPGPAPDRATVEAALGAFRGEIQQRPPDYSAVAVGGRRAYAIARSGGRPDLPPRSVTIHDLSLVDWDDQDPDRPIATLDVACSAGTYIRAIARDLGAAVGSAAYLGALVRTASGSFRLPDAISLDRAREAAAAGEGEFRTLLRPIDSGLEALPVVAITPSERDAVIRGQFIRPASGLPGGADPDQRYRLVDVVGSLVALGRVQGQRIVPDKVLVDLPGPQGETGAHAEAPRDVATTPGHRVQMHLVRGLDKLTAGDAPLFVVVGVFDGLHRGHAYLLDQLRHAAHARSSRPAVITFDAHPDEILVGAAPPLLCDPDERLVRLADAGVEVTVVQHFDRALRMTPYTEFVRMITERARLTGLLMTPEAAFGHERRGTPEALAAHGASTGYEVIVVPAFQVGGQEVRSADIRQLIGLGDLVGAAALLGRPYAFAGDRAAAKRGSLAGRGHEVLTFHLPVALPPAGTYHGYVEVAWRPEESQPDESALATGARGRLAGGDDEAGVAAAAVPAEIVIPDEAGWVEIRSGEPLPAGSRLRVTLAG